MLRIFRCRLRHRRRRRAQMCVRDIVCVCVWWKVWRRLDVRDEMDLERFEPVATENDNHNNEMVMGECECECKCCASHRRK